VQRPAMSHCSGGEECRSSPVDKTYASFKDLRSVQIQPAVTADFSRRRAFELVKGETFTEATAPGNRARDHAERARPGSSFLGGKDGRCARGSDALGLARHNLNKPGLLSAPSISLIGPAWGCRAGCALFRARFGTAPGRLCQSDRHGTPISSAIPMLPCWCGRRVDPTVRPPPRCGRCRGGRPLSSRSGDGHHGVDYSGQPSPRAVQHPPWPFPRSVGEHARSRGASTESCRGMSPGATRELGIRTATGRTTPSDIVRLVVGGGMRAVLIGWPSDLRDHWHSPAPAPKACSSKRAPSTPRGKFVVAAGAGLSAGRPPRQPGAGPGGHRGSNPIVLLRTD